MSFINTLAQNYVSLVRTAPLTEFFYLLTIIFDFSVPFILICVCVTALVYLVRNRAYAILFASSLLSGGILIYLLKIFFNVPRPIGGVIATFGQSFPSGHAAIAVIFFVMLMYIFDDYFSGLWRVLFHITAIVLIFLVAFSRVYLGVHWVSDVAGGIFLGAIVSHFFILAFRRFVLK